MKRALILLLAVVFVAAFLPNTSAANLVYDDFSGGSLDLTKWTIEPVRDIPWATGYPSEYYLDSGNENYHTAQLTQSNRQFIMSMNRLLQTGETLEYDVYCDSGSGNRVSSAYYNGNSMTGLVSAEYGRHHCGAIGYWDQVMSIGNGFGLYHFKISFFNDNFQINVTRPDGSVWSAHIHGITSPYKFEIESRSGHNGLFHIDYDNFVITTAEPPPAPEFPFLPIAASSLLVSLKAALLLARRK